MKGTEFECLAPVLTGPLVFGFSLDDPGAVGRVIKDFAKENGETHDMLDQFVHAMHGLRRPPMGISLQDWAQRYPECGGIPEGRGDRAHQKRITDKVIQYLRDSERKNLNNAGRNDPLARKMFAATIPNPNEWPLVRSHLQCRLCHLTNL